MPWFRVDDKFHEHPKVRKLRADKAAAVGVWTMCGTWAADNLSDGFVPAEIVQRFDPRERYARRLVEVGLWTTSELDGEQGYQFHEWTEYQPTAEQVKDARNREKERKAEWRKKNAAKRSAQASGRSADGVPEVSQRDNDVRPAGRPPDVREASRSSRSRPDPIRTSPYGEVLGGDAHAREESTPAPQDIPGFEPSRCRRHADLQPDDPGEPCRACQAIRLERERATNVIPIQERDPWCGQCLASNQRHIELDDGRIARCPRCHPDRQRPSLELAEAVSDA